VSLLSIRSPLGRNRPRRANAGRGQTSGKGCLSIHREGAPTRPGSGVGGSVAVSVNRRVLNSRRRATLPIVFVVIWQLAGCATELPRPDPAEAVRSRIAQVVDADTGNPIEGAVVLEVFYLRPKRGSGDFPVSKTFRDSAEAVTDHKGRFTLSGPFDSLSWWTDGLYIFKPGYGPWRFRGYDEVAPVLQAEEPKRSWLQQTWDRFTTSGVVIELRPLRTREERLKYIDLGWAPADVLEAGFRRETPLGPLYFFDVPADRLSSFQRAVDEERASLGLEPRRLDGRWQPR